MVKRIEIDKEYADILSELVMGNDFGWFWNDATIYEHDLGAVIDSSTKDSSQFTHTIFLNEKPQSEYYHYFSEMLSHLEPHIGKIKRLIRIKANLIMKDESYPDGFYNGPHADYYGNNLMSFVYYVNDSDGDTIIFDGELNGKPHSIKEITEKDSETPNSGTGIVFNSQQIHTSSTPRFTERRAVINYVFEMENHYDKEITY
jgi:hypothetical protein